MEYLKSEFRVGDVNGTNGGKSACHVRFLTGKRGYAYCVDGRKHTSDFSNSCSGPSGLGSALLVLRFFEVHVMSSLLAVGQAYPW